MPHKDKEAELIWRREWSKKKYATDPRYKAAAEKRKRKFPKTCIQCGKEYKGSRADSKFCSRLCSMTWMWENGLENRFRADGQGKYLMIYKPDHPMAQKGGKIPLHRWIMAQHLGRNLEHWEKVHHLNGDKADNRIENLIIVTETEHKSYHMTRPTNGVHLNQ